MTQYFDNGDLACFDGLSFRKDKRTGYYLNAKTHKRLHVYIWEYYNGPVPKGYHVHHKDFDKNNNEIENLELLTASEHSSLHGQSWDEERLKKSAKILKEFAIPKATEWHKSEEGREWHKKHYEQMQDKLHRKTTFVCLNCGKEFEAEPNGQNRYCSNNCKSMYRRKSGVDDEVRTCVICGKAFKINKYAKGQTCGRKCAAELRRNKKHTDDRDGACI